MDLELIVLAGCYGDLTESLKKESLVLLKEFFKAFDWKLVDKETLLDPAMYGIYKALNINFWIFLIKKL